MTPKIYQDRLGGWRKVKDRLANFTITAGGMGVLFAILLIFFYLLYEIMPLFESASLKPVTSYSLHSPDLAGGNTDQTAPPLYIAMEEQAEIGVRVDQQGLVSFFVTDTGKPIKSYQVPVADGIQAFAINSQQQPLMAMATANGVVLAKPEYRVSYPQDQRVITPSLEYPYGQEPIDIGSGTVSSLTVRDTDEQLVLVANIDGQLLARQYLKEEDFLTEEVVLEEQDLQLPQVDIDIEWMLLGPDLRWLYLASRAGDYRVIDLRRQTIADSGRLVEQGQLTDVRFLLGEISLLVSSDQGVTGQWFMVRDEEKGPRLQSIRSFQHADQAIDVIAVEHRRKGFITVDSDNVLAIYYSTSERKLLEATIADTDLKVRYVAIAPRAKAMLSETSDGQITFWKLKNEHPEVSWSALWEQVWYESYPEPDYIWQSSASNNDFEPKYSFAPLAFGTLKAAFYAMMIAAPLALCGAIYTAYFMAPAVRRKVKPLIELMEALPTVILGFLAGLWLAPFVEGNLAGVFAIFMLMPFGVLLFGFAWSRMPNAIRLSVPDGWHPVLLVPVVIVIAWGSVSMSGQLELWFFDGNIRSWLTNDLGVSFDQRNALIVGIAMGFAVVPTIFSIAEDAIFSVPKSLSYGSLALGATPWQTLVGVVIPTASPGIFSALMIGMGRAVGETMIVLMATGNTPVMDVNIFEGMRTLAANIAVEIGETEVGSSHFRVLFLAAFVLFLFTFTVNTAAEIVRQRLRKKYGSL